MSRGMKIISSTRISLPPLPQKPLPIKLSFFDSFWIGIPPVQRLMLYSSPITTSLSFPTIVENLKSSLFSTLVDFLPLAGKLTYVPSTGDVEIDLSDPSFTFIEAESDLDICQLATDEAHDVESFLKLVPKIDTTELPFSVLAVQVTRFNCGGVSLGYTAHHCIADGKALFQFIEAWTDACKIKINGTGLLIESPRKLPYDRAMIKHPKGEVIARQLVRDICPILPSTNDPFLTSIKAESHQLSRRTFVLDAPTIQSLKRGGMQHEDDHPTAHPPSTFSAISAFVWACIAQSKSFSLNDETILGFLMDCRTRLNPPINEGYFGSCVCPVYAKLLVHDLTAKDGLVPACRAIRRSIDEVSKDPLRDCENWLSTIKTLPLDRVVNVAASPKFRAYDTDFGWGRPDRSELVSMNHDGEFALVGGKEEGTVQVSVNLNSNQMESFIEFFLGGLSIIEIERGR